MGSSDPKKMHPDHKVAPVPSPRQEGRDKVGEALTDKQRADAHNEKKANQSKLKNS